MEHRACDDQRTRAKKASREAPVRGGSAAYRLSAVPRRRHRLARALGIALLAGCSARPAAQTYLGGQSVELDALTAAAVAAAVRVTVREQDVLFQAPALQTTKLIDLRRAGQEIGVPLGEVERVRIGALSGILERSSGALQHYLLFQTNFVIGSNRYRAVALADGQPLDFTLSRAPDPCVPSCFPDIEAVIVAVPDPVLRANAASGLALTITLVSGDVITVKGIPAYVQGYLDAVDRYRRGG